MQPKHTSGSKRYAHADYPAVKAVLTEMLALRDMDDVVFKLDQLRRQFIISKKQLEESETPRLVLWIKGFALEAQDGASGVIGHYALIAPKKTKAGFTLTATKLDWPANTHPQRALVMRDTPNWGHPVLRAVRKGKAYPSIETAQAELDQLHKDFPTTTIPNPGRIYCMIYCKDRPPRERLVRHTLELKANDDGSFFIHCTEFTPKFKPAKPEVEAPATTGKFTARVAVSRARKLKKPSAS